MNFVADFDNGNSLKEDFNVTENVNTLNWYPFDCKKKVLQVGIGEGKLTRLLSEKCLNVTVIEDNYEKAKAVCESLTDIENLTVTVSDYFNSSAINQTEVFDYITLIGTPSRIDIFDFIKFYGDRLNANGSFLIAVDNKFALRFFSGNPENATNKKFLSLTGYKHSDEQIFSYSKALLENGLIKGGYNTRFYYPLPDYRLPNVIFTDDFLPEYTAIGKYNPYYLDNSDIIFNELDVFKEILKSDKSVFPFLANSYIVEASKGECNSEFKYISFNVMRKEKYRLITKISDKYVQKQVENENAKDHYNEIISNIDLLNKADFKTTDFVKDGTVYSRYTDNKYILENIFVGLIRENRYDELVLILDKYLKAIAKTSYKISDYRDTVFSKFGIAKENSDLLSELNYLKNGMWDMTFGNCFYIDNEFVFFDQEWNEQNLPVEFILYRAITYLPEMKDIVDRLYKKYDLEKYLDIFMLLDNALQEEIRDNDVWCEYKADKNFNIDATKQEICNMNIRSNAQTAANENLTKEIESLHSYIDELHQQISFQQKELELRAEEIIKLNTTINEMLITKVKRKLKKWGVLK